MACSPSSTRRRRWSQAVRSAREAGYTTMDAYSPFPVEGLPEALGFQRTKMPLLILLGGIAGARERLRLAVLLRGHQLSDERGRPAAQQLAVVHSGDVRADGADRVADRGVRIAGAVRSADAVSSAVPCAALRRATRDQLLSVHRGGRSAFRAHGDEAVPEQDSTPAKCRRCRNEQYDTVCGGSQNRVALRVAAKQSCVVAFSWSAC